MIESFILECHYFNTPPLISFETMYHVFLIYFHSLLYLSGDTIVYRADVGREMYIMRRGLVEVLSNDDKIIATLGPGGYFGEVRNYFY